VVALAGSLIGDSNDERLTWRHALTLGGVLGSLDGHDFHCRRMAASSGQTAVSVAYRLAPEHPFPAAYRDALDATGWWFGQAASFGCDPSRIFEADDSTAAQAI
jgi:acetyl esterase